MSLTIMEKKIGPMSTDPCGTPGFIVRYSIRCFLSDKKLMT